MPALKIDKISLKYFLNNVRAIELGLHLPSYLSFHKLIHNFTFFEFFLPRFEFYGRLGNV